MITITVWLLVSIGGARYGYEGFASHVVERFPTLDSCESVRKKITSNEDMFGSKRSGNHLCVQATILKP